LTNSYFPGSRSFSGKQSPFTRRADNGAPKCVLACHDIGICCLLAWFYLIV
jgi:hypothetical protein